MIDTILLIYDICKKLLVIKAAVGGVSIMASVEFTFEQAHSYDSINENN